MNKINLLFIGILLSGCAISPQQKGTVTMADRGTMTLTQKGDRLMDTGIYAKRDVPPEYAEGYVKGMADQTKREYEDLQNAQRWLHFFEGSGAENTNRSRLLVNPSNKKFSSNKALAPFNSRRRVPMP